MTDLELIQKSLGDDHYAFQKLIEPYVKPLYGFVFYSIHDKNQTEDIVQETFIKVWSSLKKFDQTKNFKVWLYTIAKNTCLDYLRKKPAISFSQFEADQQLYEITDPEPLPPEILNKEIESEALTLALEKLPYPYREVLLLYYREDFNFREIAEILKESINTVKSRYRRGLAKLKKICTKRDS